jgi:hypothetical protein
LSFEQLQEFLDEKYLLLRHVQSAQAVRFLNG